MLGDVLTVLPFQNAIVTMELSGADIVASLEYAVSGIEQGRGAIPQVAGTGFSFDPRVPPEQGRIRTVDVRQEGHWVPIEPNRLHGIVTHTFPRKGGDGYALLASEASETCDYGPSLKDGVAKYLAANAP